MLLYFHTLIRLQYNFCTFKNALLNCKFYSFHDFVFLWITVIFPFSLTPELNKSFLFFTILDITGICTDNIVNRHEFDFYLKL